MDLDLKNKIVFVSGGSKGIGRAIVEAFLSEGARVCFIARTSEDIEKCIQEMATKHDAANLLGLRADASMESDLLRSFETLQARWGKVDILISNVGNGRSVRDPMPEKQQFARVWSTNFTTTENLVRIGLGFLNASDSHILLISSITGIEALGAPTDYSVAKSAIIALSKNLARKLAPDVRVNCIAPGNVYFEGGSWDEKMKADPELVHSIIHHSVPMKRFGTPEEIAAAALFLSSSKASFVTGNCFIIDGGQTLSLH